MKNISTYYYSKEKYKCMCEDYSNVKLIKRGEI